MKNKIAVSICLMLAVGTTYASPVPESQEAQLEKLVSQNDACRLVISNDRGVVKLYFPNKDEAVKALARIYKQSSLQPTWGRLYYQAVSPDCDIDVLDHQRGQ